MNAPKEFAKFKKLPALELDVTDELLRTLGEIDLFHALRQAAGIDNSRPASAAHVVALNLNHTQVTDAGLKALAPLKNLAALDLSQTMVHGPGLKDLASLKKLTSLNLMFTRVADADLKELAGLKKHWLFTSKDD